MRPWVVLGWLLLSLGCAPKGPPAVELKDGLESFVPEQPPELGPFPQWVGYEDGPPLPRQVERPALRPRMPGVDVGIYHAAFSPDGRYVVTGNSDGSFTLWDTSQDQVPPPRGSSSELKFKGVREYGWDRSGASTLFFTPDGKAIVAAGGGAVWRWDRDTGRGRRLFRYPRAWANGGTYHSTGGRWLVVKGNERGSPVPDSFPADWPDITPELLGKERGVSVWDTFTGRRLAEFTTEERVRAADVSPDGKRALLVDKRGVAEEWDLTGPRRLRVLNPRPGGWFLEPDAEPGIMTILYVPGSRKAVSAQWGSRLLRVWDLDSGRVLKTIDPGKDAKAADTLAVSPDGKRLACTISAKRIIVCDLEAGRLLHEVNDYEAYPSVLRFSPDSKCLLIAGYRSVSPPPGHYIEDRVLLLWDVEKQKLVRTLAYP